MSALKLRTKETKYAYEQGRQARKQNKSKIPPYNNTPKGICLNHHWYAGWHEVDIELKEPT